MMTEMYEVFKGQSLGSVTLTLALTHILANVEGENDTNTASEDPSKLVKASSIILPDPDALIPYTINEEVYYLTAERLQAHIDKEEQIKKAKEEAILFAISKSEVIKVVWEEAKKLGIHPKEAITTKAGEKFKKAQDAKHEVLKRQHTDTVRESIELRKHKFDNYMWTIIMKLKTISGIKIHLKTKADVITVFRGTYGRNFDIHKPFSFGEFGISELDELGEIISNKKNVVVQDLINLLSRRYERIRKIPEKLRIKSALPAPAPEQALFKSSRNKRKHMELKPEIKIPLLECNRALLKIFCLSTAWSSKSLSMGSSSQMNSVTKDFKDGSPENARFSMKLKNLIAEHPDQEKLKSKKVMLEALGYEMN
nr:hypothetical protein [Tanacetum cinerariifolium]